jgi:hypothetical protein
MIRDAVVTAIGSSAGDAEHVSGVLESVSKALSGGGHGRVVFWLALEGLLTKRADETLRFDNVAKATHMLREAKLGKRSPSLDDTKRIVALASLVLLAESVLGPHILRETGLGSGPAVERDFRAWFSRLILRELEGGSPPT